MTGIYQLQFKWMLLSEGWEHVSYSNTRKGPADHLYKQEPHRCGDQVRQYREGTSSHHLACQHFSTYLLGRSFIAESDHKPLEMIAMKNLANVPPHLQRMLLELQRYKVTIKYQPGKEMQLANALSHCPVRASQEIKLDM